MGDSIGAAAVINAWLANGDFWPVAAAPFVGSFCGTLITRLPAGRGVVWGRSACDTCGHTLGMLDLVPIASFVALRGRCRFCQAPIGWEAPGVELAALGVAVWSVLAGLDGPVLWASCVLGWTLLTLGWIDARCFRLPDALTLPLIPAGLAEAAWLEPEALRARAFGAAIGYTALWSLAWLYRRARKREGLGLGDAKLLAAGGAWVGAWLLGDVILAAAVAALVWALRRGRIGLAARVPFGPFLAGGIWVVWLYLG